MQLHVQTQYKIRNKEDLYKKKVKHNHKSRYCQKGGKKNQLTLLLKKDLNKLDNYFIKVQVVIQIVVEMPHLSMNQ